MYLRNIPKDSFLYIATQASETSKGLHRTMTMLTTAAQSRLLFNEHFNLLRTEGPLTNDPISTFNFYLWLCALQTYLDAKHRPRDFVLNEHICRVLYQSDFSSAPYSEFSTNTPFMYIDISKANLKMGMRKIGGGYQLRTILGGVILNLSLIDNTMKSYLNSKMHDLFDEKGTLKTLDSGYAIILTLESDEQFEPYGTVLLFSEREIQSNLQNRVGDLMLGATNFHIEIPEEYVIERGVAFDMLIKAVIFLKQGNFTEDTHSFGPLLKSLPSAKTKKATPPQGGKYRVTYIQEQEGGHGISWLPSDENVYNVTNALEDLDEDATKRAQQTPRVIPDHYKMIWVTHEYIKANGITDDNILKSGPVPRRNSKGEFVTKTRYLIAKEFTYGFNVSLPKRETDVVRVSMRNRGSQGS